MALFDVKTNTKKSNVLELESKIKQDSITDRISNAFDYKFEGNISTTISIPKFPTEFQIGLIVGSSGSGKSSLLKLFGNIETHEWKKDLAVASHFSDFDEASSKFGAVGLNSIPTWLKPYQVLSTGEKFRADMARSLHDNAVIDEFTSVVNRECAISCSSSISKYIRNHNLKNVVFASCHDDIIEYLQPDWVYDTDKQKLSVGRCARQHEAVILKISQCSKQVWSMFSKYHYLSADLNLSADCYLASWNDLPVAFGSILAMPGRFGKNDSRLCVSEHRIVVLPDFQGMGIGNRFSEYLGELYTAQGYRYFGKTANPRMGEHRERSDKWRATSSNLKSIKSKDEIDIEKLKKSVRPTGRNCSIESTLNTMTRLCYSHEYIGNEELFKNAQVVKRVHKSKLF